MGAQSEQMQKDDAATLVWHRAATTKALPGA